MANVIEYSLEKILAILTGAAQKEHRSKLTVLTDIANNLTASTTSKGVVELATTAETTAGTDTARVVTPAGLAGAGLTSVAAASVTVAGKVELATNIETQAVTLQTHAVTPYGLGAALAGEKLISVAGVAAPGAVTAVGLKVGDVVRSVSGIGGVFGAFAANFEASISVNDQIQQTGGGNLSANHYLVHVYRPVG